MTESFGVVANVHGDSRFRDGAKVWLLAGSGLDRPLVSGLSPSGQIAKHRVKHGNLSDFRAAWIPPQQDAYPFGDRSAAEQAAINLQR